MSAYFHPRVNRALYVLSSAYFLQATGALSVIGAMDAIAATWSLTRSQVGYLITAFGLSFALLAPLLQVSPVGRWPRRRQLLVGLVGFSVFSLAAAAAPSYALLLAARVGMGASAALVSPVLGALGSSLVPPEQQGAAIARVLMGLSVAAVVGTPAASLMAHLGGPRWMFGSVALLGAINAGGVLVVVPAGTAVGGSSLRTLALLLGRPRALAAFLVVLFIAMGVFTFQAYLEPVVKLIAPEQPRAVATALIVLGAAGVAGNAAVGWAARSQSSNRLLAGATLAMMGLLAAMAIGAFRTAPYALTTFYALLALWAMAGDVVWPTQQRRVVEFWPEHRGLALALTASFMFFGMGAGAALGAAVHPRYGLPGLAAAASAALVLALAMLAFSRRPQPRSVVSSGQPA